MSGMPPHKRNLQFKIPDWKQNLVYHIPRCLPRHGGGYVGRRNPPPLGRSAKHLKLSPRKQKKMFSTKTQHLKTKPLMATIPNPPPLAHQPMNQRQPYMKCGERKVPQFLQVKFPSSNICEPDVTRTAHHLTFSLFKYLPKFLICALIKALNIFMQSVCLFVFNIYCSCKEVICRHNKIFIAIFVRL